MISINGNVDTFSYPKVDFVWINDLLKDLTDSKLYITLVGRKEDTKTRVRKYKDEIFLAGVALSGTSCVRRCETPYHQYFTGGIESIGAV